MLCSASGRGLCGARAEDMAVRLHAAFSVMAHGLLCEWNKNLLFSSSGARQKPTPVIYHAAPASPLALAFTLTCPLSCEKGFRREV